MPSLPRTPSSWVTSTGRGFSGFPSDISCARAGSEQTQGRAVRPTAPCALGHLCPTCPCPPHIWVSNQHPCPVGDQHPPGLHHSLQELLQATGQNQDMRPEPSCMAFCTAAIVVTLATPSSPTPKFPLCWGSLKNTPGVARIILLNF